jgi:ribosomal protein L12E/L44/L45/RPP1/RPP2
MKYLAAYALLALGGKTNISIYFFISLAADDIKALLGVVGASTEDETINRIIASLKGQSLNDVIAKGVAKLGASAAVAGGASKGKEAKVEKKE